MKLKDSLIFDDFNDCFILIDSIISKERFNGMVKLNKTSKDIIECFKEEHTIDEVVDIIFNKYDKDKKTIKDDVEKIVSILKEIDYLK